MNVIEGRSLSKSFGDFRAVKEISFEVRKGEIFGFLGPNGAGKTTTINMLTGLARPTSGEIEIFGMDGVREIKKVQRIIGIVPDESNLYEEMSGFDNLTFCASLYGIEKETRERRARELLRQFRLEEAGERPFKAYSKGMKRKLTIAAGIIHEPAILFLDEPTTGIDVASARQIRQLIQTLHVNGTTIFLTTHYIEEAQRLCERIGFIVEGRMIMIRPVEELLGEAQREHMVEFVFDAPAETMREELANAFKGYTIHEQKERVRIVSQERIELMPLMRFFEAHGRIVNEARVIKPTLEEIFVKVTGIEAEQMKSEKEGRKK